MCIIITKEKGITLPDNFKKIIKNSFNNNPDGSGLIVKKGNRPFKFVKGLMTFKDLWSAIQSFGITCNDTLVVHCRIATSDNISPEYTHPFEIDSKVRHRLKGTAKNLLVHNGIISCLDNYDNAVSDTAKLACMLHDIDLSNLSIQDMILNYDSNNGKFVIVYRDKLYLIGDFITDNGIKYSNTTYKKNQYKYEYIYTDYNNSKWFR